MYIVTITYLPPDPISIPFSVLSQANFKKGNQNIFPTNPHCLN